MPTQSDNAVGLGAKAPDFRLTEPATGKALARDECRGRAGMLVMFICNHCPYVVHVEEELARIGRDYQQAGGNGLGVVAICANDAENYPQDAPDKMAERARERGYSFPYLHDEDQSVARAYDAMCTPEFMLFDADMVCVYTGRMDGSSPGNSKPNDGAELRAAMDAVLAGNKPLATQNAALGCSIKWRA